MLEFDCSYRYPDGFQLESRLSAGPGCTVLLGPSGAGKTTILSLIAGLVKPDTGRITIDKHVLFDHSNATCVPPRQRGIGLVTQAACLFPHMDVQANLEFGRRHRRPGFNEIDFDRLVDVLELGALLGRRPDTLSGGEARRVSIGRALASRPRLLLMDEPLSSLDDKIKRQILSYLTAVIAQWHVPTIFVTHDQTEASAIGNQTIRLDHGRIQNSRSETA